MSPLTLPTPAPSWPRVPTARSPLTHEVGSSSRPSHQQRRPTRLHPDEWRWQQWRGQAPDRPVGGRQRWRPGNSRYDQGTSVFCPGVVTPPQKSLDLTALRVADGRPPPPPGLALHFSRLAVRSIGRGERGRSHTVAAECGRRGAGEAGNTTAAGHPHPLLAPSLSPVDVTQVVRWGVREGGRTEAARSPGSSCATRGGPPRSRPASLPGKR